VEGVGIENRFLQLSIYLLIKIIMKPLFTESDYKSKKPLEKLPCQCYQCSSVFLVEKRYITQLYKGNTKVKNKYCSRKCLGKSQNKTKFVTCDECGFEFEKSNNELKRTKNNFCSHSCHSTYVNKNKTHGNKRSKLEIWIEEQLGVLYPNLLIEYNQKSAIQSELDIYIPSLNIAFELNGIFHYEPIFGIDKLNQIQSNDKNKFQLCIEAKIDLCIIDTSQQKYVKPKTSQKYLNIIINIINERLLTS
jgi:hypothetical protein